MVLRLLLRKEQQRHSQRQNKTFIHWLIYWLIVLLRDYQRLRHDLMASSYQPAFHSYDSRTLFPHSWLTASTNKPLPSDVVECRAASSCRQTGFLEGVRLGIWRRGTVSQTSSWPPHSVLVSLVWIGKLPISCRTIRCLFSLGLRLVNQCYPRQTLVLRWGLAPRRSPVVQWLCMTGIQ